MSTRRRSGVELQRNLWWCQTCYWQRQGWPLDGSGQGGSGTPATPCPSDPCACRWCDPSRYRRVMARTREWRETAQAVAREDGRVGYAGRYLPREQRRAMAAALSALIAPEPRETGTGWPS